MENRLSWPVLEIERTKSAKSDRTFNILTKLSSTHLSSKGYSLKGSNSLQALSIWCFQIRHIFSLDHQWVRMCFIHKFEPLAPGTPFYVRQMISRSGLSIQDHQVNVRIKNKRCNILHITVVCICLYSTRTWKLKVVTKYKLRSIWTGSNCHNSASVNLF